MSRVRVFADVQNQKPGIFVVTVDNHLTLMGDRSQVIEELRDLWMREYLNGNQYREFVEKMRGK